MTDVPGLLRAAADRLAGAGVPSPRVDAELLLAHVLDLARTRLITAADLDAEQAAEFERAVTRRAAREPLQHITGRAPFRHVEVPVGPGVFVPRPETELLVDAVLPVLRAASAPVAVDLCSGTGALALALADEVPGVAVTAVEFAAAALAWLRRNTARTTVRVIEGDVTDPGLAVTGPLAELATAVDAVVCNPPYVPEDSVVDDEVRADPDVAVFAGHDGLDVVPGALDVAGRLLRSGGVLALEHDETHADAVRALAAGDPRWATAETRPDLTGRQRFLVAARR